MMQRFEDLSADRGRHRASTTPCRILGALALVATASPLLAVDNLLANSEFSNFTVFPWRTAVGEPLLSNLDHSNNPNSGSARLVQPANFISSTMISEKVAIQGGGQADMGGYFRAASTNPSGSRMRLDRFFYSDTSCSAFISGLNSGWLAVQSSWASVLFAGTATANAKCVRMQIVAKAPVKPNGDYEAFDLLADGLFLRSTGATSSGPIFLNGFESGNLSGWIVVN